LGGYLADRELSVMSHAIRNEKGATLVLIAAALLMKMGFAAMAIDVGAGFNERRQDQSAADVGALAAAQFAQPDPGCSSSGECANSARANGADEAIAVASATLDNPSAADWDDASKCATPPAGFTVSPASPCVAFDANLRRAWVRIPTIETDTFFGRVLGVQSLFTSAEAIADTGFGNPGAVLPFLLPGIAADTDYNCLKTSGNPGWGPCSEELPSTGNFGSMDFTIYGNPEMGTAEACGGNPNTKLISNIARGVDHPLGIHLTGSGDGIQDDVACPVFSAEPNMVVGQPGVGSNLEDGLLYGGSVHSTTGPYPGRLAGSFLVRNSGGGNLEARIDNTPLWDFLTPTSGDCSSASVDTPEEMVTCIASAKASGTVVFSDAIANSRRFAFTPAVWESDFLNPNSYYYVKGYQPVYLDATYYGCSDNSCDALHTVGVDDSGSCPEEPEFITCGTPGPGNRPLVAVTAYILDPEILPPAAKTPQPGAANQRSFNLSQ
jgi:Flp pilus assembly protein TadG